VPDDRKLVILGHLRDFGLRRTYLPRPAGISLDEILDYGSDFADHDDATRVAELAEQRLESGDRLRTVVEYVVSPGENDRFYGIDLEKRSADETA
jgi:hypothetical protein